ncbi:MAG TPA: cupin domain-containing protein [Victivallales bacterium]|nr:cupin domain-containing protein [Victivallales bacterium]
MIKVIKNQTKITEPGNTGKEITEIIGRTNTDTDQLSIAKISSPKGWSEPGQTPEFDEYTTVLKGILRIKTKEETVDIEAGQSVIIDKNTWVKYSTPHDGGAEYIAVCLPAFNLLLANRD